jgi:hypothetical protein
MKPYLLPLLLLPLLAQAQNQQKFDYSTQPQPSQPASESPAGPPSVLPARPTTEVLKPIEFREFSDVWGNRSWVSTSIGRIYSYDGIDVADPERELWPTLLALNDPDIERLRWEYNDISERRRTANVMGTFLSLAGLTMATIGGVQNDEWNRQRNDRQTAFQTVMETRPNYVTRTCNNWSGSSSGQGTTNWTCSTDRSITYVGTPPPFSVQVQQGTTQVPVTRAVLTQPRVTSPNGRGLIIGGVAAMLVGTIVYISPRGNRHETFHRAVQTYNRALKQRISWEFTPYTPQGLLGPSLVGRF